MILKSTLWFFLSAIIIFPVFGQEESDPDNNIWSDLFVHHTLNNNIRFIYHANYKYRFNKEQYQQVMFRPVFIFTPNDYLFLQGGIQFLYSDEEKHHELEVRPWQGFNLFYPRIGNIYINNFFRVEERFFVDNERGRSSSFRGRYAIMTFIPLNKKTLAVNSVYLWPYTEIYSELNNPDLYIERIRYSMGLGYRFSEKIRVETVFMIDSYRDSDGEAFYMSDRTTRLVFRYLISNNQEKHLAL